MMNGLHILSMYSNFFLTFIFLVFVVKVTPTTYHSNMGVQFVVMLESDTSTLPTENHRPYYKNQTPYIIRLSVKFLKEGSNNGFDPSL
jgi:hypothetical protein